MLLTRVEKALLLEAFRLSRRIGYDRRLGLPFREIASRRFGVHTPIEGLHKKELIRYITPEGRHARLTARGQVLAAFILMSEAVIAPVVRVLGYIQSLLATPPRTRGPRATCANLTITLVGYATAWFVTGRQIYGAVATVFGVGTPLTAFYVVHRAARLDGMTWQKSLGFVVAGLLGGTGGFLGAAAAIYALGLDHLINPHIPFLGAILVVFAALCLAGLAAGTYLASLVACRVLRWKEKNV